MEERFQTFTVLISSISRSIRRIKTEEMDEYNLKSPHVSCLYYLFKFGALTAKQLCDICQEDKAALSRSVEHLEKSGYIENEGIKKKYRSPLNLTKKGEEVAKKIVIKIDKILTLASEGLSEEKRTILYEGLNLINSNLEKFIEKYGD